MEDVKLRFIADASGLIQAGRAFDQLTDKEKQLVEGLRQIQTQQTKTSSGWETMRSKMLALGAVVSVAAIATQLVAVTSRYEDLRTTLTTVEQSSIKAAKSFDMLNKLAAETPFSVEELTASYIKLRNRGLEPTRDELVALGDLAASQGKSLDQITEAMLDAMTGENERLKEFGIQAKKMGDQVQLSFKGITQTVAATPAEIQKAITSFGQLDGVAGGMAARSQTLSGMWSSLKDNVAQLAAGIGNQLLPLLKGALAVFGTGIEIVSRFLGITKGVNEEFTQLEVGMTAAVFQLQEYNKQLASGELSEKEKERVTESKSKLVGELNEKYSDYLANLVTEKTSNAELNMVLARGIELMQKQRILRAIQIKAAEEEEKALQIRMDIQDWEDEIAVIRAKNQRETNAEQIRENNANIGLARYRIEKLLAEEAAYDKRIGDLMAKRMAAQSDVEGDATQQAVSARKNQQESLRQQQAAAAAAQAQYQRDAEARLKAEKDLAAKRAAFMAETSKKETDNAIAAIEDKTTRELATLAVAQQQEIQTVLSQGQELQLSQEAINARLLAIDEAYIQKRAALYGASNAPQSEDIDKVADEIRALDALLGDQLPESFGQLALKAKKSFEQVSSEINKGMETANQWGSLAIDSYSKLLDAQAARTAEHFDEQKSIIEANISGIQENITFLQEAEANATGKRKENIQQQIALQQAQAVVERQRIAQIEQQQKQAQARAAQRQKQLSLFSAIIDTSAAIAKAVASAPWPANLPGIAFAAASGGAQIAAISAQPIPKFRQGGVVDGSVLQGPRHSRGGILIEAEGGERIFSREKSAQFAPLFDAIQRGQLSPQAPLLLKEGQGVVTPALTSELRALRSDLGKLKQVHVNLDAKGFRVAEQTATRRTNLLNQRYRSE